MRAMSHHVSPSHLYDLTCALPAPALALALVLVAGSRWGRGLAAHTSLFVAEGQRTGLQARWPVTLLLLLAAAVLLLPLPAAWRGSEPA